MLQACILQAQYAWAFAIYLYEVQLLNHVWCKQDFWNRSGPDVASRYGEQCDRHEGVPDGLHSGDDVLVVGTDRPRPHLPSLCHGGRHTYQPHAGVFKVIQPDVIAKEGYNTKQKNAKFRDVA